MIRSLDDPEFAARARDVEILGIDFDGVMTDNKVYVFEDGREAEGELFAVGHDVLEPCFGGRGVGEQRVCARASAGGSRGFVVRAGGL